MFVNGRLQQFPRGVVAIFVIDPNIKTVVDPNIKTVIDPNEKTAIDPGI
jgi:hypothetical protein